MNEKAFRDAYAESRNGISTYYRHALIPSLLYSDGVQECAAAGCYWLLDVVATEVKEALHIESGKQDGYLGTTTLVITAKDSKCDIALWAGVPEELNNGRDQWQGLTLIFKKHLAYTDFPEGTWNFVLAAQEEANASNILHAQVVLCLPSED